MPHQQYRHAALDGDRSAAVVGAEGHDLSLGSTAAWWSMPVFFTVWVVIGVVVGVVLGGRGHDRRFMVALGVGLGPLMVFVAAEAARRRRTARPRVLAPRCERSGGLDLVVLVHGAPESVRSLLPTIEAVIGDVRTLTLARAVPYEWVDAADGDMLEAAGETLVAARAHVPIDLPALLVVPGSPEGVARWFEARGAFVLHAFDDDVIPTQLG